MEDLGALLNPIQYGLFGGINKAVKGLTPEMPTLPAPPPAPTLDTAADEDEDETYRRAGKASTILTSGGSQTSNKTYLGAG